MKKNTSNKILVIFIGLFMVTSTLGYLVGRDNNDTVSEDSVYDVLNPEKERQLLSEGKVIVKLKCLNESQCSPLEAVIVQFSSSFPDSVYHESEIVNATEYSNIDLPMAEIMGLAGSGVGYRRYENATTKLIIDGVCEMWPGTAPYYCISRKL